MEKREELFKAKFHAKAGASPLGAFSTEAITAISAMQVHDMTRSQRDFETNTTIWT
jgi:hypothetical protein